MNPVRAAIVQTLTADGDVTGQLSSAGAIFHRQASRTAHTPYVVFQKQSGSRQNVFGGGGVTEESWLVKAVDYGTSASRAEDIAQAVDEALDGQTVSLSNGLTAYMLHETDVDYAEQVGDETYQHVGAIYRIIDP